MSKSSQAFRTIREVADWLDVAAHVLRFWESKFPQIKPVKRAGGRRYYRPADMELVGGIKVLLHDRGMTIRGVQKMIREEGVAAVSALSPPVDMAEDGSFDAMEADEAMTETWHEMGEDASEDATDVMAEESVGDVTGHNSEDETVMGEPPRQAQAQDPAGHAGPADAHDSHPTPSPGPKLSLAPPPVAPVAPVAPPPSRQQASLFDFEIDNEEPDEGAAESPVGAVTTADSDPQERPVSEGAGPMPAESTPAEAVDPTSEPELAAETSPGDADPEPTAPDPVPATPDPAPMSELLDRLKVARTMSPARLAALRPALAALCDRMRADPRS